ncbi:hypothetical protein LUZ60_016637 [Juncus effusus]|nr:hypothetical protein LUZ60_016637 [Juncus effusus]
MGGIGVKAAPFTYASHVLAVAAAVLVLVWCVSFRGGLALNSDNKNLIFNLHPVLMLIGYIILGSEAIMAYKTLPFSHDMNKLIHLVLHAIAIVLGSFGIYCAFKFHNESGIANLYSFHSWLGLGTIILYTIQWIFGFVTFFLPVATPSIKRMALPWHVLFGILVYVFALATALLGFLEKLTFLENSGLDKYGTEAILVNCTALVVLLFGVSVVVAAIAPKEIEESEGYTPLSDN